MSETPQPIDSEAQWQQILTMPVALGDLEEAIINLCDAVEGTDGETSVQETRLDGLSAFHTLLKGRLTEPELISFGQALQWIEHDLSLPEQECKELLIALAEIVATEFATSTGIAIASIQEEILTRLGANLRNQPIGEATIM